MALEWRSAEAGGQQGAGRKQGTQVQVLVWRKWVLICRKPAVSPSLSARAEPHLASFLAGSFFVCVPTGRGRSGFIPVCGPMPVGAPLLASHPSSLSSSSLFMRMNLQCAPVLPLT